jgi:hypothetical protein
LLTPKTAKRIVGGSSGGVGSAAWKSYESEFQDAISAKTGTIDVSDPGEVSCVPDLSVEQVRADDFQIMARQNAGECGSSLDCQRILATVGGTSF